MKWVIILSGIGAGGLAHWASQYLSLAVIDTPSADSRAFRRWRSAVACGIGGVTGWFIAQEADIATEVLFFIVMLLFVVQAPIDLLTHRLIRKVTYTALTGVTAVITLDVFIIKSVEGDEVGRALAVLAATGVLSTFYWLLHRLSPQSLGWGDVLLVIPLTLAVGYVALGSLAVWQLLASVTGAVHGVILRWRRGEQMLPFGPHLLGAAWLVIALSV